MNTCLNAGTWKALRSALFATLLLIGTSAAAQSGDTIELNPSHPDRYVVVAGDTLWDISAMFLSEPWYWPEIWYVNPQIDNPHLIYPGDILTLVYVDGKPQLHLQRGSGTTRLSPSVRTEDGNNAIPSIPFSVIEPFLRGGMVMDKSEAESLPYIVALRDHMIAGAGHEIYVKDIDDATPDRTNFSVLRLDDELRHPETNKLLGYEIIFVGTAELRATGDPDTLFLTNTDREARPGDRIRQIDLRLPLNFYPQAPAEQVDGRIIAVVDGLYLAGQYQMVILDVGMAHGLDSGSVLAIWQKGKEIRNTVASSMRKKVVLPDNRAGNVMVVKAYEEVSYALIMEAVSEMRVGDLAINP
jgi:hypothetical protein